MKKVQISVPEELMERVDEYAKKNFMNRSTFFCYAATQVMKNDKILADAPDVAKSISELGSIMDKVMRIHQSSQSGLSDSGSGIA